ncbi:helix-turn-helix domain-containing protein [Salipiger abyssi]|uniref:helix-turn-helix domain-containing protein n=1 Tax=Salipiger abyssi TaxID=1250539 RepID=UPI0040585199
MPVHEIARILKRSKATIHREIKRNWFSDESMALKLDPNDDLGNGPAHTCAGSSALRQPSSV